MFAGKPVIGIVGGIGSGKSFVAGLFGELGCLVINSDEQVKRAYHDPTVKQTLRDWWGDEAFGPGGELNRRFVAAKIFGNPAERQRLEELIHPLVHLARQWEMAAAANNPKYTAFVWDTPLLFETELNRECDAVVFIESPLEARQERVWASRGWDGAELARRGKFAMAPRQEAINIRLCHQ